MHNRKSRVLSVTWKSMDSQIFLIVGRKVLLQKNIERNVDEKRARSSLYFDASENSSTCQKSKRARGIEFHATTYCLDLIIKHWRQFSASGFKCFRVFIITFCTETPIWRVFPNVILSQLSDTKVSIIWPFRKWEGLSAAK